MKKNILTEIERVREIMGLQNITEQNNAQIGKLEAEKERDKLNRQYQDALVKLESSDSTTNKEKQRIYETLFNQFATYLGMPSGLRIERIAPIKAQISEQTLVSVLTTDEVRELAGYAPLEQNQKANFSSEDRLWLELSISGYNDEEIELIKSFNR